MAIIAYTGTKVNTPYGLASLVSWLMGNSDNGTPARNATFSDRSVQVDGTFGGATVTIQGSNDGVTYYTLSDPAGVALTFTTGGLRQILQVTNFIRPLTTGGAGSAINVNLVVVGK